MVEHFIVGTHLLFPPEERDLIVFAVADVALVGIAHSLLGPEGTLVLHVDFVGHEEGSGLTQRLLRWGESLLSTQTEQERSHCSTPVTILLERRCHTMCLILLWLSRE
jgi:hypothetical protein